MSPNISLSHLSPDDLRHARRLLGLTQAQLGDILGITAQEIHRKEAARDNRENRPITLVQARAIAGLLLARVVTESGADPNQMLRDFTVRDAYALPEMK